MGSYKIDLNAPKRHVPNIVMKDAHIAKMEAKEPEKSKYQ
jgi:hypothetical protein